MAELNVKPISQEVLGGEEWEVYLGKCGNFSNHTNEGLKS
jgi:hypothetical protein